jgi:hypothetical protein
MANTFVKNRKTDLIAVRAAEVAGYLTVGSKSYFGSELVGKRNGDEYDFVVRDAGKYVRGKDITGQSSNLVERKVTKKLQYGNVMIDTDFVEAVTDVNWDKEIAIPNGKAIIEGLTQDVINDDIGRQNVAFVGIGWSPLTKANGFLRSISSEAKYGFVDPMIDSILASSGRAFTPVTADPLYAKGDLTKDGATEYRFQQFLPQLVISEELADELASATVASYTQTPGASADVLALSGVTETIPAGTPLFVEDVYATNLIGNKTSTLKAFIAIEDATAGSVKVRPVDLAGQGTKEACDKNGDAITAASFASKKLVNPIKAGVYYTGIIRLNGTMEFDTLKKTDWSNADLTSNAIEGITVHTARAVNVEKGENKTRWNVTALAGIVEPRGVAYVCVKDVVPNLIVQ